MRITDRVWAGLLGLIILAAWVFSTALFSGCGADLSSAELTEARIKGYVLIESNGELWRVDLATSVVTGDGEQKPRVVAASVDLEATLGLNESSHVVGLAVEKVSGAPHVLTLRFDGLRWSTTIGGVEVEPELVEPPKVEPVEPVVVEPETILEG
jgi:hypothetical protein